MTLVRLRMIASFGGVMKSLTTLSIVLSLVKEYGARCSADVDRDLAKITARFQHEGESFLTITLPSFCRAFEQALAAGSIASVAFDGFVTRSGAPSFLRGLTRLVFSDVDGTLLDMPSIEAIQAIRQITLVHSKVFEVCDSTRAAASIDSYVRCEEELNECWFSPALLRELRATATQVFGRQLSAINESCASGSLTPKHGPGSTADRISGNRKWDSPYWTERLDRSFPVADYLLPGYSFQERLDRVELHEPGTELPVKVITVPKTAAKARVIAMEPANVQYAQQAVLSEFTRVFSDHSSRFVGLKDQETNKRMAQKASASEELATLDLSEASDRVAVEIVDAVFGNYPALLAALTDSRSIRSRLPDGRILTLVKFASMGSATCFPVESIVFATVALNAIRKALRTAALSNTVLNGLAKTTRVFGDDIIIPTRFAQNVIRDLVAIAAKPNASKSFWTGKFRESCGGEYYDGEDVSVARLRSRIPKSRHDSLELVGLVAFRNHLYNKGLWSTASHIDEWVSEKIPYPIVKAGSPVVGRESVAFQPQIQRYHPDYQSPLVKGVLVRAVSPSSESSGEGKLLKCTLPGRTLPFENPEHLMKSGRPDRVYTKVGWGSPF